MASRYYDKRGERDHRQKRNISKANYGHNKSPKPDYNKPADPFPDYGMPVIPRPDYTVKIKNPVKKVPSTRIEDLYAVPNKNKNINKSKLQPKHSTSSNGSLEPEFLHKLEKSLVTHDEKLNANKRGQLVFTKNGHKSPNQHQSHSRSSHQSNDIRFDHQATRQNDYNDPHYDMRYRHPGDDINWQRRYNEEKRQHFEGNIIQKYDYGPDEYHRNPLNTEYIAEHFENHQYAVEDPRYQEFSPEELDFQNLTIDDYENLPYDDGYNYQEYQNEYNDHEYYVDEYGHPYFPPGEYGGTNMVMTNIR